MNATNIAGYKRISKQAARKRFADGLVTYAYPSNMRPGNMWIQACPFSPTDFPERTFDQFVNEYEYYNCNHAETGRYTAFYTRED